MITRIVTIEPLLNKYIRHCSDDSLPEGLHVVASKQPLSLGQFLGLSLKEGTIDALQFESRPKLGCPWFKLWVKISNESEGVRKCLL